MPTRDRSRDSGRDDDNDYNDEPLDMPIEAETVVECPWCGESVSLTLDPYGGSVQEYTEDCEICCNPWQIRVRFDPDGSAAVTVDQSH